MTTVVESLSLGLLGSIHCLGMCGVFSAAVGAGCRGRSRWRLAGRMAAYVAGKTLSYAFLGTLAFALGARLLQGGALEPWRRAALALAGLTIALSALHLAGWLPAGLARLGAVPGQRLGAILRPLGAWSRLPSPWGPAVLGFLNGFLPCGLVLAAVLLAVASESILAAAGTMAVFGLATAPALLLPAYAGQALSSAGRPWLRRVAAVALLALAPWTLWRGGLLAGGPGPASCCEPAHAARSGEDAATDPRPVNLEPRLLSDEEPPPSPR